MTLLEKQRVGKPLYQALADSLLGQIRSGDLEPGQRLPSEADLIGIYGVGRNTVRHALSELAAQGVLKTIQGVGTFVEDGRLNKTAEYLLGFTQEMSMQGREVSSRVLEARLMPADSFLARRLQLQLGEDVVYLARVRYLDGEPTAIERAHLPHALCRGILKHDFAEASLYQVLTDEYAMRPDHAEQEIEAKLASGQVADLLDLEQPAVVFVFHRATQLADGRVIEYVDSEVRADQYRFYTNLKLHAPQPDFAFRRLPVSARVAE
jgi:GntR family transcriptional regulator